MRYTFVFFILSLSFFCTNAVETSVQGTAQSYAGRKLALKIYSDQIIKNERTLAEALVDASGNFSLVTDISHPVQAFIPMGVSNGFIYLEPGKNYTVKLSEYTEKSLSQKLDPYFSPANYLLEIEGLREGDFNYQMMEFEEAFDYYSMKCLLNGNRQDSIQSFISQMQALFTDLDSEYQRRFKEYRYLLLRGFNAQNSPTVTIPQLNKIGVDTNNPAFWDIFDNLFSDFIRKSGDNREDVTIFRNMVDEGNAKTLFSLLTDRYGITDVNLKELTAIKWVADLINSDLFEYAKVVVLLRNLSSGIQTEQNRNLLAAVISATTTNTTGAPAANFIGTDSRGKQCQLSDYKGQYVYLNFGNTQIDKTRKDLDVLARFYENHKNALIIMNVFLYDTPEQVARIAIPYKDKMVFLHVDNPDELKKIYSIRNVPSYFLLDREGNFLMTKNAEPSEEVRVILQHIFQENKENKENYFK